jgi:DNA topoisomerase-2
MHVFDENCKIKKITCPEELIYNFYKVRKQHYIKRKKYLLEKLTGEYEIMDSKIKFIRLVVSEKIIIFNKKKDFIIKQITENNLIKINGTYDYLLDMKLWSLTLEKIEKLSTELEKITTEIEILKNTSIQKLWTTELHLVY